MVKVFNMKHLAVAICVAIGIPASPVQAGWFSNVRANVVGFFQNQVKPALHKPETYIAGAALVAAGLATYYYRDDIYWAFQHELPLDRARNRVRSRLASLMKDRRLVDGVYAAVMGEALFVQAQEGDLIQKDAIDACVHKHFMRYEFSFQRSHDWNYEGVQIVKHSVRGQSGLTCGYHALWNGIKMYQLLNKENSDVDLYKSLQSGPPIEQWKDFVDQYERGLLATQLQANNNARLDDSKQSNYCFENITDGAIEHLLDNQFADELKPNVTVISNPSQYSSIIDANLPIYIEALKSGQKNLHVFIVGNMVSGDTSGSCGHWVAFVIQRCQDNDGNVTFRFHTADSLGSGCRLQVQQMVRVLELNGLFAASESGAASSVPVDTGLPPVSSGRVVFPD